MHELLWDLRQTPHARELLEYLCDDWRHLVAGFIDTYEEHVASRIGSLRVQVIHNDINPHNVLVADANPESISGIIDFGDMLTAPLVHDIAISAAYAVADTADLLEAICELAGGFCEVVHLEPNEIEVLIILSTPVSCSSQRSQLGEPRSIPTTPSIF
jgi:Ser/Thr protein kinase RdoA (MazF antagonist)